MPVPARAQDGWRRTRPARLRTPVLLRCSHGEIGVAQERETWTEEGQAAAGIWAVKYQSDRVMRNFVAPPLAFTACSLPIASLLYVACVRARKCWYECRYELGESDLV
jgi:hypothetical protein